MTEVTKHSVHTLVFRSLKRTHDMFLCHEADIPESDPIAEKLWKNIKARSLYGSIVTSTQPRQSSSMTHQSDSEKGFSKNVKNVAATTAVSIRNESSFETPFISGSTPGSQLAQSMVPGELLRPRTASSVPKPKWHAPWKLYRVISGHIGWVRCVAFEPGNEWFASGAADRVIKIWDSASGKLKLSLTGHVSTVRGLAVSSRHPYLFSCGEDRQVKCWDLEYNKVIRHYHGHLSAVYDLALHPTIDILLTCGRDSTVRVWDMRTKVNIHSLTGHSSTVSSVIVQGADPQVLSGSNDSTIRLWDLAAGKCSAVLTNHKKSVRSLVLHPTLNMFASASPDNIKEWRLPEGKFIQNLSGHSAIVNCLAANSDGVLVSGADNGTMHFWDWKTGYNFQRTSAPVQPGSLDSEAGIFQMKFDNSGSRLVTCEADKTIKMYKEDESASEESHPLHWKPDILKRRKF